VSSGRDGIIELHVPTPFSVGDVNCFLLEGDPLTLVDCGPATSTALLTLEDGLAAAGHRLADVGLVLLTHGHVDHAGLAATLAGRHGTEIACIEGLAPELESWFDYAEQEDDHVADAMVRHGVPPQVSAAVHAASGVIRRLSAPVAVDRRLRPGDTIVAGSRELRIWHRPGHSRWDTVLVDESSGVAFLGDHLLLKTSSNAALTRAVNGSGQRVRPLVEMRDSLMATRELGLVTGFGGHGKRLDDIDALVATRLDQQESRADDLEQLLRDSGPTDAHHLATLLLGERAITQAMLAISEVVGHLDLLIERGTVIEHEGAALCQFEAL
jgi:glyoxylase-like metal-dependent hydrolase (beta-lactamase superfamily II)